MPERLSFLPAGADRGAQEPASDLLHLPVDAMGDLEFWNGFCGPIQTADAPQPPTPATGDRSSGFCSCFWVRPILTVDPRKKET